MQEPSIMRIQICIEDFTYLKAFVIESLYNSALNAQTNKLSMIADAETKSLFYSLTLEKTTDKITLESKGFVITKVNLEFTMSDIYIPQTTLKLLPQIGPLSFVASIAEESCFPNLVKFTENKYRTELYSSMEASGDVLKNIVVAKPVLIHPFDLFNLYFNHKQLWQQQSLPSYLFSDLS